jgi:two-component system, OmpR family, sensor histidine kinase KdpD
MKDEEEQLNKLKETGRKPRQISLSELDAPLEEFDAPAKKKEHSHPSKRGKLKIFLGAAAGVGKTYTMLEEANQLKQDGVDVVVGYVELHGRKNTEKLLDGLEIIERLPVQYRGTILEEMNTEAIIARKPKVALIDELAHTNAPGMKYQKRYEDIEEILEHGIDVYSTVNVQHLESLNDRVFDMTGTRVRETFPDRLFDIANEVVLVDLPAEDLRERIRQGKVYKPEKIEQALQNFFRTGNLIALRELALRETADAVETSGAHREHRNLYDEDPPTANPFVLICVATKPQDSRVVRQGWRFAKRLNAPAEVINVSRDDERTAKEETAIAPIRRLARALNLPFSEVKGDPASLIIQEAKAKKATLLVLGESTRNTWYERFFGTFTDKILDGLDGVDVYIVGDPSRRHLDE